MKFVFEVSWEVCNKVGGIHTVIASKAREATEFYGDAYIAIGPDTGNYNEFEEVHGDAFFEKAKAKVPVINQEIKTVSSVPTILQLIVFAKLLLSFSLGLSVKSDVFSCFVCLVKTLSIII